MKLRIFVTAIALSAQAAWADTTAAISLATAGAAVAQDFNSLPSTGTGTLSANTPPGVGFVETGTGANTIFTAGTGAVTAGDTYSFGATSGAERALGGLQSGAVASTIGLRFVNSTGAVLTSLQIAYTGEQWRLGAATRVDRLDFSYQIGATNLTGGTWTDVNALDFTGPITTGTVGALDGNAAANRVALSQTITGLSIAAGAEVWIRWSDLNATGADDGLAIDDLSVTPIAAAALPVLSISSATALETSTIGTDTSMNFTLNLTAAAPAGGINGTFSTSDATASAGGVSNAGGNDYASQTNAAFAIAAGATSGTISVPVRGDMTYEFDEAFAVTLNAAGLIGATLGTSAAVGTITNDDGQPTVLASSPSVTEGTGPGITTLTFELSLDGPTQRDCRFAFESFANANAQGGGVDFDNVPNTQVNLSGASQTVSVNVSIVRDALVEPNETFDLDIFGEPFECNLPTGNPVGTIVDDDSIAASVSVNDTSVNEGNSGTSTMTFTITRTNGGTAQTVNANVSNIDASAGSDYTAPTPNPQTLAFAMGELSKTINVSIIGERVWEANEALGVTLSAPTGGLTISDSFGLGTITNDDIPVINVSNASITEGNGPGSTTMNFTLTAVDPPAARTAEYINGGPPPGEISVSYRTIEGSALNPGDYLSRDSVVLMSPNNRTQNATVPIVGDTVVEPTETFTLETYNNLGFTIGTTGTGTIIDNDATAATVSISSESVTETNSNFIQNFTVTRSNSDTDFSVRINGSAISATAGNDFNLPFSGTLVMNFAAGGALSQTIAVTIVGDTLVEPTETFALSLLNVTDITGTTTIGTAVGTGTIFDDDTLISIANASVAEGNSGITPLVFTLTRTGITNVAHSVTFSTSDQSATVAGNDYQALNQVVNFAIGETTQQVTVNVVGDRFWEDSERFLVSLSNASANVQLGPNRNGFIQADDLPKINITDVSVVEGNSGTVNAVFTVTASDDLMPPPRSIAPLPNGSNTFIEIDFATAPGSASSGTDYTAANGILSFDLNDRSKTITVPVIGDTSVEMDETFLVNLSLRAGSNSVRFDDGVGQGTIQNDDAAATTVTLAANPSTLTYGQATTLTATVTCGSTPTGSVTFSNGASSLGSGALIAGSAAGTGIATLNLPLLDVASYSVIASYAGVAPCNGATSSASTVLVNPAATSLSLSGPARSRINQPIAFSGALNVLAPGAGTPSGTVTLTSVGSSSCSYSSPSATSCNLSWNSFGSKTINASFAPSTGNYLASSSNSASTFVFALADLDVSLSNQVSSYQANGILVYTLTLNNRGPDFAPGVRLRSQLPAGLIKVRWTCAAVAGAICPEAGGVLDINALVQTLPANGQLIYTLTGVVVSPAPLEIRATGAVTLPDDGTIEDPVLSNQSATDTDSIDGIFRNGFEDQ